MLQRRIPVLLNLFCATEFNLYNCGRSALAGHQVPIKSLLSVPFSAEQGGDIKIKTSSLVEVRQFTKTKAKI